MKRYLRLIAILALIIPGLARAQLNITAEVGGIPDVGSATLLNFDGSKPSLLTLTGAYLVTGSDAKIYEAPYLSGSTAAFFGDSSADGPDTSQYVAVEANGSATLNFSSPQDYFGLLWGSLDQWNELQFYNSRGALIGSVLGTDVVDPSEADGDPGVNGTYYVNITSSTPFSKVVASSPLNSFEFDDVAFASSVLPVPEPTSSALIAWGLGIIFLVINRKRA